MHINGMQFMGVIPLCHMHVYCMQFIGAVPSEQIEKDRMDEQKVIEARIREREVR